MKRSICSLALAGFLSVHCALAQTDKAPPAASSLAYRMKIDPGQGKVHLTGIVTGHTRKEVSRLTSFGLRKKVDIRIRTDGDRVKFSYAVPIAQTSFNDPREPVLNQDFFCGFVQTILLAPRIDNTSFREIPIAIEMPGDWKIVTSAGIGQKVFTVDSLEDLTGTLVNAGDYVSYAFDLPHENGGATTKCHVAIRGERDWDDLAFIAEWKRLVQGQVNYFGGRHPAPIQFLSLNLLPKGRNSRIPAFNRRAPGHDTVMALHSKPRNHFEFLGMLAHEHLHNWYPYAMKSDLGPWFMEGLNDYVAYRGLMANGLHTREQFTGMLSKWHREYHYCLKRGDKLLMPYRRGMLAAWVFDIELRRATEGKRGLTDVLRNLIDANPDGGVVRRTHFVAMLKEVSGRDMEPLYKHLVEDDSVITLSRFLKGSGFRIVPKTRNIAIVLENDEEETLFESILSEE